MKSGKGSQVEENHFLTNRMLVDLPLLSMRIPVLIAECYEDAATFSTFFFTIDTHNSKAVR